MNPVNEQNPENQSSAREVEEIHRSFYAAWEAADIDGLREVWLDSDDISISFPGGVPGWGRPEVLRQLAEALVHTPGIQFLFEELRIAIRGDIARLTCVENVVMSGGGSLEDMLDMPSSRLAVNSVLVRTEVGWRMWSHMSGPILSDVEC